MCDKMAISTYILKIVEKDPFLRLQMSAKLIKLVQNETNRWSIFFWYRRNIGKTLIYRPKLSQFLHFLSFLSIFRLY